MFETTSSEESASWIVGEYGKYSTYLGKLLGGVQRAFGTFILFHANHSRPFHEFDAILLWGGWEGVGVGVGREEAAQMYGKIAQCTVS